MTIDLMDDEHHFVLTAALREFAARQSGEADDSATWAAEAEARSDPGAVRAREHHAEAERRRK
ncbi:hypothetical protein [Nonomuraea sp. NPDC049709]|uniref:hypothetical protein n=1 Tax=Nonomuraea sp. NPDC049709 TaxID=3154736 RepID=UPI0034298F51